MKKLMTLSLFFLLFLLLAAGKNKSKNTQLDYPSSWPKPLYDFSKQPLQQAKIDLGKMLFYDPVLSRDSSISCSSCHLNYTAFTHVDHALSHGIGDSIGTRNSPVLINLAWMSLLMWDGAVNHIDVQALAPITHPKEMGETFTNVISKLQRSKFYPMYFERAFGQKTITGERVLLAMAQFQLTLVSSNAKYDQVMRKEKNISFTAQEEHGHQLFLQHCSRCHTPPLFTNNQFMSNGISPNTQLNDEGRKKITQQEKDKYLFKVPTLRNIEFSYPYMHDGRFKTLYEVLNHYSGIHKGIPNQDEILQNGISLDQKDKTDLVSFLLTLSDKTFLFNQAFAYPKNLFEEAKEIK
jgi:cytochrome c peroxidase